MWRWFHLIGPRKFAVIFLGPNLKSAVTYIQIRLYMTQLSYEQIFDNSRASAINLNVSCHVCNLYIGECICISYHTSEVHVWGYIYISYHISEVYIGGDLYVLYWERFMCSILGEICLFYIGGDVCVLYWGRFVYIISHIQSVYRRIYLYIISYMQSLYWRMYLYTISYIRGLC